MGHSKMSAYLLRTSAATRADEFWPPGVDPEGLGISDAGMPSLLASDEGRIRGDEGADGVGAIKQAFPLRSVQGHGELA